MIRWEQRAQVSNCVEMRLEWAGVKKIKEGGLPQFKRAVLHMSGTAAAARDCHMPHGIHIDIASNSLFKKPNVRFSHLLAPLTSQPLSSH